MQTRVKSVNIWSHNYQVNGKALTLLVDHFESSIPSPSVFLKRSFMSGYLENFMSCPCLIWDAGYFALEHLEAVLVDENHIVLYFSRSWLWITRPVTRIREWLHVLHEDPSKQREFVVDESYTRTLTAINLGFDFFFQCSCFLLREVRCHLRRHPFKKVVFI